MKPILRKIGFNDKEIDVYLTLLQYGVRPASFIAQKANLNRSTTYNVLEDLLQKTVVYQTVKSSIRNFGAFPPSKLLEYIDKQSSTLLELKSDVSGVLSDLEALAENQPSKKARIRFFEGETGMQDLLHDIYTNSNGNTMFGILSMKDMYSTLGEKYYEKYIEVRAKRNIELNVIRSDKKEVYEDRWKTSKSEARNVRFMPPKMTAPDMSFYLYDGDKVAFFASHKESYGLLVESKEFYQTQKTLFDALWQISE